LYSQKIQSNMRDVISNLKKIVLSEEERRCAVVAILVSMKGMISNSELSWLTSMSLRSVQRLWKSLEDSKDPHKGISREPRPELSTRKVRTWTLWVFIDEGPTRSLLSIAKELEVRETTIHNCVKEDL
ncbi:Uncharacterized protein FKW44_012195, partial [Caligus rogercresseyi]